MNSPLLTAYFRFLQVARTLTDAQETALSANHRALLEAVVLAWHEGQPLSVRQAISLESLGSPATLHKRLATLRSAGQPLAELAAQHRTRHPRAWGIR